MRRIYYLLALLFLVSCGKSERGPLYRIGVDPSWYPLDLMGKDANVTAFSNDLLKAISKKEGIRIERIGTSWDNLLWGLKNDKYDAILSSLYPYVFNTDTYGFSNPYLNMGPLLISQKGSDVDSIGEIGDREIGVFTREEEAMLIAHNPDVIVRRVETVPEALTSVAAGELDGALIGMLPAISYIQDLFSQKLQIVSKPLTAEGLRLVTLYDEHDELLKRFNRAVENLKKDGTYLKLAEKWNVAATK